MMLLAAFVQRFGGTTDDIRQYFAPGRVNLIGEHIDYNGGRVLPFALSQGITAAVRFVPNSTTIRMASLQTDSVLDICLTDESAFLHRLESWQNYPLGVIRHLSRNLQLPLPGADILLHSCLPMRSGLSSSAAVEVLTAYLFLHQLHHPLANQKIALAQLCQQVENQFVGVQCGIMDQFAVAAAQKGYAIWLDCHSLEHRHIPFVADDTSLVVMNTNKNRALTDSKYNERREECDTALRILRQYNDLPNLSQALESDINRLRDDCLQRRVRHVVEENKRVDQTVQALQESDWQRIGYLLNASHLSLQKNYEVTGFELDTLVAAACSHRACLGARMTGAGFGGCAIALVKTSQLADFGQYVSTRYETQTQLRLDIYVSAAEAGVRAI